MPVAYGITDLKYGSSSLNQLADDAVFDLMSVPLFPTSFTIILSKVANFIKH